MVGTNDIARSKRFYDALLKVLGAGEAIENTNKSGQRRLFYRHDGASFGVSEPIDGQPATVGNGGTIGFKCSSPEQVREFHDVAIANGGTSIEGTSEQASQQRSSEAQAPQASGSGWVFWAFRPLPLGPGAL
jgi:catechol 2,3-dioxygenase-like lactoylglutathione lyase family enzyme